MTAVHEHLPEASRSLHRPGASARHQLTPRHYPYLKISEGCNHRCTFCIIPSLRGDLASRPIGEVMREAENLVKAGVKELLVISPGHERLRRGSQVPHRVWGGRPHKARMGDLATALGELVVWVRLHYVYPYPHVDDVIALMADGKILPYTSTFRFNTRAGGS